MHSKHFIPRLSKNPCLLLNILNFMPFQDHKELSELRSVTRNLIVNKKLRLTFEIVLSEFLDNTIDLNRIRCSKKVQFGCK